MSTQPYAWISSLLLGVSLGLPATACTDDGAVETDASHLTGRVDGEGAAAGGIAIEVYALDVRGTLDTIAGAGATTDAGGRYAIDVALPDGAVGLVLRTNEADMRAVIIGEGALAAAGTATVTMPPIDTISTVVTDVTMHAIATSDAALSVEQVSLLLAPGLTAQLAAAATYAAALSATADATVTATAAWTSGLEADLTGATEGSAAAAAAATAEASLALAASLDRATDAAGAAAAYSAYVEATVTATLAAGYGPAQVALAADVAVHAMTEGLASVEDVGAGHLAAITAIATTAAIEAQLDAIGGAEATAVATAGVTLRATIAELTAAARFEVGAVTAAFVTYQAAVAAAISAQLTAGTTLVATLATAIDAAAADLRGALEDAHGDAAAIVAAYLAYHAEVVSTVHIEQLATAGMNEVGARATLQVLAELELATR